MWPWTSKPSHEAPSRTVACKDCQGCMGVSYDAECGFAPREQFFNSYTGEMENEDRPYCCTVNMDGGCKLFQPKPAEVARTPDWQRGNRKGKGDGPQHTRRLLRAGVHPD